MRALQLLWGSRREQNFHSKYVSRWAYDRLTDSSNTTFPRSLNILLKEARDYELTTYSKDIPTSTDRLLHPKSLNEGLVKASIQRCQEMREEYPELETFFDFLVNMKVLVTPEGLNEVRQKMIEGKEQVQEIFQTPTAFENFLRSIGLLYWDGSKKAFRFADIYTYGFNMNRKRMRY